jgi:hypothetical protein
MMTIFDFEKPITELGERDRGAATVGYREGHRSLA